MAIRRRVVITGLGAVTAVAGGGRDVLARALADGTARDGERVDRTLAQLVDPTEARRLSRVSQLTLAAARLAREDAGPTEGDLGVVLGTELGDLRSTIAFA